MISAVKIRIGVVTVNDVKVGEETILKICKRVLGL